MGVKYNIAITIIVITFICIFWVWYMLANPPQMINKQFNTLQFKTGDLILFHAYDNINPLFICSYWGHIGIVYKNPNDDSKPVIFEAVKTSSMKNCLERNKSGIIITDLETRLEKYPGLIACKFLNKDLDINLNTGLTDFMQYAKKNMYYNDNVFYNGFSKKFGQSFNHATNCGELAVLSLIKIGLLDQTILNARICHHLLYVSHLTKLNKEYYYHTPIEITFDPF